MKQLSKKTKLSLGVIIGIIIISIISIFFYLNGKNNNVLLNSKDNNVSKDNNILFKSFYANYAWGAINYGYYIDFNGDIKEYDDYDNDRKLKSAKISYEELTQLKELASMVEDKYEVDTSMEQTMSDGGTSTKQIYNSKLSKWVILLTFGDQNGENSTETSQKILEMTNQLYKKYLYEN